MTLSRVWGISYFFSVVDGFGAIKIRINSFFHNRFY